MIEKEERETVERWIGCGGERERERDEGEREGGVVVELMVKGRGAADPDPVVQENTY